MAHKPAEKERPGAVEEATYVALVRAVEQLTAGVAEVLKPAGLTPQQYNVLRILRGAGETGLTCGQIKDRLLTRDSDLTRLLDRLEKAGLVKRRRAEADRRAVVTHLAPAGLVLLASLDEPVRELHRRALGHLGEKRLRRLSGYLERL